ncbi:MAG: DUF4271 domain-containing protein [Bacteroidales bacterium]|nr:DUF4271 domain-containing protein [Bacteroidales bacterium]
MQHDSLYSNNAKLLAGMQDSVPDTSMANELTGNSLLQKKVVPAPKKTINITLPGPGLEATDTVRAIVQSEPNPVAAIPYTFFPSLGQYSRNSVISAPSRELKALFSTETITYSGNKPLIHEKSYDKSWVFGLTFIAISLLVIIRIYFQKYLPLIFSSAVNRQTAEKLLREKNILVRRVFIFLNLIFLLATSLFLLRGFLFFNIKLPSENNLINYMLITILLFLFLTLRLGIQQLTGYLFESQEIFREYIHNTYLLHKNLGLIILPLAISTFYLRQPFSDAIFYISGGLVVIGVLYQYLRGLQIILKHNVFLLYSILYLCTLEILPAIVGIKFALSLR